MYSLLKKYFAQNNNKKIKYLFEKSINYLILLDKKIVIKNEKNFQFVKNVLIINELFQIL